MEQWVKELKGDEYKNVIKYLKNIFATKNNIVILCIGTDRCIGDCLGPYTGMKLANSHKFKYPVYGTLEDPIHAKNLESKLKTIILKHNNPFIIAIDAALGDENRIKNFCIKDRPIQPGQVMNKNLPLVGNISITGVVNNTLGSMEFMILQNTSLNNTIFLSNMIYKTLLKCV